MNSIEPANSKEPVYRVWEGNEGQTRSKEMRYFKADLVLETTDWKLAKEALNDLYANNKGGLITEKENAHIVHGETTIVNMAGGKAKYLVADYHERPVTEDYFKESSFTTQAYDERRRIEQEASKNATIGGTEKKEQAIPVAVSTKNESTSVTTETSVASPENVKEVVPTTKAIFKKDGYEVPETIKTAYDIDDGKFKAKGTNSLRFEDHGKKLATPVEDRAIIADMMLIAQAKNWGELELKGTDNFRRLAWMEAEVRGLKTTGFIPNEQDILARENLKRERATNEVIPITRNLSPSEQSKIDAASLVLEKAIAKYPDALRKDILARVATAVEKGNLQLPTPIRRNEQSKDATLPTKSESPIASPIVNARSR